MSYGALEILNRDQLTLGRLQLMGHSVECRQAWLSGFGEQGWECYFAVCNILVDHYC